MESQETNTNNSTKQTITVRGLTLTFSNSQQIERNQLTQTLDKYITHLIQTNNDIATKFNNISIPYPCDGITKEILNSSFVEIMHMCISLISEYCVNAEHLPSKNSDTTKTNINYEFKTVEKTKETAFLKYWKQHFDELKDFKNEFGHCNVSRTTPGYTQLGNWLTDQRRKLRKGKLTKEQFDMLSELGMMPIFYTNPSWGGMGTQ